MLLIMQHPGLPILLSNALLSIIVEEVTEMRVCALLKLHCRKNLTINKYTDVQYKIFNLART